VTEEAGVEEKEDEEATATGCHVGAKETRRAAAAAVFYFIF
jgi:hypothetical protein